ncbi:nucleoside monophosphate kinase [Candidatus Woesearchaeota archaeon]|nr:nucleoside monophosphate kinase [Candidatus Woesearchaeota archaeon]
MIITISGRAGSGKSTIAKLVAKKLGLKHFSSGDFMRQMAKEKGISLLELSKLAEKDKSIDKELDERQIKFGKEEDNFIIDGRLSAFFIPKADFKIFLDADKKTRAERILKDARTEERGKSLEDIEKKIEERERSEAKRYREYYSYDCYDKSKYNHVIDTTNLAIEEVVKKVLDITQKEKIYK